MANNTYTIGNMDISDYTITLDSTTGYNGIYTSAAPYVMDNSGTMSITGENADITLNGKSMRDWMEKVEERLAILEPNAKLEAEWAELKELGERYRALEQEIKERQQVWNILKD